MAIFPLIPSLNLSDVKNAATCRTNLGLGTMATQNATAVAITGGTIGGLTSFGVRSTGAAFDVLLANSEVLTASRTLSLSLGDTARTLTLSGSPSISGITTTGTGTIATGANTLTVSGTATVSQDYTTTGTPTFAGVTVGTANAVSTVNLTQSMSVGVGLGGAGFYCQPTFVEAASGTHTLFCGGYFAAPIITAGAAAVTDAATVYISGAPAASGASNRALFVFSGNSVIRDRLGVGYITTPGAILDVVGENNTAYAGRFTAGSSSTPAGVIISDAAASTSGFPLLNVTDNAATSEWFRVNSGGAITLGGITTAQNAINYTSQSIASAATTSIGTATGNYVFITGATTITSLGSGTSGWVRFCRFSSALTLTHSATLILPGSYNITTATNDTAIFVSHGGTTWLCVAYKRHLVANDNLDGTAIASAASIDIGGAGGEFVAITGTTAITALGTAQSGLERTLRFNGALTLTYNATSLILPTSADITTAANDTATFRSLGSGNWLCVGYQRASGAAVLALGTMSTQNATAVAITGGTAAGLTTLGARSSGAAFDLQLGSSEVLTANRLLSFNVGDAARTMTLSGSPSLSGITTTGTGTIATGTFTLTVPATGTAALLATANVFTASQTVTSGNTTQVTTASALALNANSLTTGTGLYAASSSLTTGFLMNLQVSGTAAAASQTALNILTSGATATNAITTYGAQVSNTHTNATSGTNVGLLLNASGATTANYALITTAGNVGIGTSTPTQALSVGSTSQFNVTSAGAATAVSLACPTFTTSSGAMGFTPASGSNFNITLGTTGDFVVNTTHLCVDTSAGFVGIGTATPTNALQVVGNVQITNSTTSRAQIFFGDTTSASQTGQRISSDGDKLELYTGSTRRVTVDANGLVGIGVTVPTAYCHVAASTTARAGLCLNQGVAPTTPVDGDIWYDGANLKARIAGVTKTFTLV